MFATTVASVGMFVLVEVGWSVPVGPGFVRSLLSVQHVQLQKQPDAWSEGVPLPLAFDCYATKVLCPPWYWNRGPGWLSSQGVFQLTVQSFTHYLFTGLAGVMSAEQMAIFLPQRLSSTSKFD